MAAQFVHLAEHRDSNYAFADWNLRLGLARPGPAPGLGALAPAGPLPKGAPAFMVTGALASSDHAKALSSGGGGLDGGLRERVARLPRRGRHGRPERLRLANVLYTTDGRMPFEAVPERQAALVSGACRLSLREVDCSAQAIEATDTAALQRLALLFAPELVLASATFCDGGRSAGDRIRMTLAGGVLAWHINGQRVAELRVVPSGVHFGTSRGNSGTVEMRIELAAGNALRSVRLGGNGVWAADDGATLASALGAASCVVAELDVSGSGLGADECLVLANARHLYTLDLSGTAVAAVEHVTSLIAAAAGLRELHADAPIFAAAPLAAAALASATLAKL
eukprot:jgi/Chrpa1/25699/Chrysochromulina_OHIO_Genome00007724-RA